MDKSHWFWNSKVIDLVEKWLLDLTHWIWAKRHASTEVESVPVPEPVQVQVEPEAVKKPAVKRTPKAKKGNEWSVKE